MNPKRSFIRAGLYLTGDAEVFSLNERIFHLLCSVAIVALIYNVPFNYLVGLPQIALLSLGILLLLSYFYYLSRFRKKTSLSISLCCAIGIVLFVVNYFLNSGIQGPTDLFFCLLALMMVSGAPGRQYNFWVPLSIVIVLGLHAYEYFYPAKVAYSYQNRADHFLDIGSAYMVVALVIYFSVAFIRRNYEGAWKVVEEKALSLEQQNTQITRQKDELEKINAEKNKLLSIIAHDLRSPIANIQNYLELLAEGLMDEEEKKPVENELLQVTRDTLLMLSSLLLWSKSQMEGVTVSMQNYNLPGLLAPILELEKPIAGKKDITLTYDVDAGMEISADENLFQIVTRNIISNAIKFTPQGGLISISAACDDEECVISITDNGPGIAADKQKDVFSMSMVSVTGTANEKGTGLGLALCKQFTELQGGRIWFYSAPGIGTTFYIALRKSQAIITEEILPGIPGIPVPVIPLS